MNIDILVSEDTITENIHHIFGLQRLLELLECKTSRNSNIIKHMDLIVPDTVYITIGIPKGHAKEKTLEDFHLFYGFVGKFDMMRLRSSDAIGICQVSSINTEYNLTYINKKAMTPPLDFSTQPSFHYPVMKNYVPILKESRDSMFEFIIDVILEYSRKKDEPTT